MYMNVNAGQRQERVSRRITASVLAHWQHSAKNTSSDSTAGTVNAGRPEAAQVRARNTTCRGPAAAHAETIIG
jgi:hypothetical protein